MLFTGAMTGALTLLKSGVRMGIFQTPPSKSKAPPIVQQLYTVGTFSTELRNRHVWVKQYLKVL